MELGSPPQRMDSSNYSPSQRPPSLGGSQPSKATRTPKSKQQKQWNHIVPESSLLKLFSVCRKPFCGQPIADNQPVITHIGMCIKVKVYCDKCKQWDYWTSTERSVLDIEFMCSMRNNGLIT